MTTKQRTKCAYNLMRYLLPVLCALVLINALVGEYITIALLTGAILCTLLWSICTMFNGCVVQKLFILYIYTLYALPIANIDPHITRGVIIGIGLAMTIELTTKAFTLWTQRTKVSKS